MGTYKIQDFRKYLKNPQKYKTNNANAPLTLRSGWEIQFAQWLDRKEDVIAWNCEEVIIPYIYDVDGKQHRYFMDFWMRVRGVDGVLTEYLIEIKPNKEKFEPKMPQRKTARYYKAVATYIKNQNKWAATEKLCQQARDQGKRLFFEVITEKEFPFI